MSDPEFAFLIWYENEPFQVYRERAETSFGWLTVWRVKWHNDVIGKDMYMSFKIGDWESMAERSRDSEWLTSHLTSEFKRVRYGHLIRQKHPEVGEALSRALGR